MHQKQKPSIHIKAFPTVTFSVHKPTLITAFPVNCIELAVSMGVESLALHGTRPADSHLNVSLRGRHPQKVIHPVLRSTCGTGGVDSCSQSVCLHPWQGSVWTCKHWRTGKMSPTLTKIRAASSFVLWSEEGNEVSLDSLTDSCHCLKNSQLCAECSFELGVIGMQSVGRHQTEPWSNMKVSPALGCHRNHSLAILSKPKWQSMLWFLPSWPWVSHSHISLLIPACDLVIQ